MRQMLVAGFAALFLLVACSSSRVSSQAVQPDDWDEFEEDEFVAGPATTKREASAGPGQTHTTAQPKAQPGEGKLSFAFTPAVGDWYYVEAASILVLVLYAANYYIGGRTNRKIALSWGRTFAALLSSNFSRLGDGGGFMIKESESKYRVPAVGRRNCYGLQATLDLLRRHDLFARVYEFIMPSQDRLIVEVAMENIDPLVFALVPNSRAKTVLKELTDLGQFAHQVSCPELNQWFTVFAESQEAADMVLSKQIVSAIAKYQKLVRLVHISDQFPHTKYKRILRLELNIVEPMTEMATLMRMVMYLIDHVPTLRLFPQEKAKATKKRNKLAEEQAKTAHAQRQEAAQQKKADKKAKEKEKLKELPAEQQAKAEEREARRARKKKLGKMKVVYG